MISSTTAGSKHHAAEVLRWSEELLSAMTVYEDLAGPAGYQLSELDMLMRVGCAAIALEAALSACGFGPEGPSPGNIYDDATFVALTKLRELCLTIRLSRHAATKEHRAEVISRWGVEANGGWEWARGETTLPRMAEYAVRLGVLTEMLRAAMAPHVEEVKPAPETPIIYSLGNSIYRVGDSRPYEVNDAEDAILQAFLRRPAMSEKTLASETRNTDARIALIRMLGKYDRVFDAAVIRPVGKSAGGYCATVKGAES